MPLPDPYLNEPAVQVDATLVIQQRLAQEAATKYQKEADRLKTLIIEAIGDAHAAMVGEDKVFTYRPEDRWATARLIKERQDLAQHFYRTVKKEEFDLDSFRRQHPDIAEQYRVRSFRAVE